MNKNKGFTLIELLVVIAIIGILASVVLAALSSARSKGADAKIQSQLGNMRAQSYLYTGTGAVTFSSAVCAATANSVFDTANGGLGNLFGGLTLTGSLCNSTAGTPSTGSTWAAEFPLSNSTSWCVDSSGVSKSEPAVNTAFVGGLCA